MGIQHQVVCGSRMRSAKRTGDFGVLTRREKAARLRTMTEVQLRAVAADASNGAWIIRQANRRITFMNRPESIILDVSSQVADTQAFEALVERFKAEGKPDPVRSARASQAASKQAAARKAKSASL